MLNSQWFCATLASHFCHNEAATCAKLPIRSWCTITRLGISTIHCEPAPVQLAVCRGPARAGERRAVSHLWAGKTAKTAPFCTILTHFLAGSLGVEGRLGDLESTKFKYERSKTRRKCYRSAGDPNRAIRGRRLAGSVPRQRKNSTDVLRVQEDWQMPKCLLPCTIDRKGSR